MSQRLSSRAESVLAVPPTPEYIDAHFANSRDAWHESDNPNGYIGLCIAENRLVWDILEPRIAQCRDLRADALSYDAMVGSHRFRETLAGFMGRTFLSREVAPEHIAVLNGAGSVLELLFYVLCDPGDGVLVPTPSYTGFWSDLETRDQTKIVPVHCRSEDDFRLTTNQLDEAIANADRPVKALLYTNPSNPLGRIDSPEQVIEIIDWARDREIHLVLDEIYALSTFGETKFVSGAELVRDMHDRMHIVWAFSKDFAMSGLRAGVLYTENERVMAAVQALAYWACTSGDTQSLLQQILSDERWVDGYITENQRRLRDVYERVTAVLDSHGVKYLPAEAGLYFVLDVRSLMDELTWEAEDALWRELLDEHKINLTPGSACHNGEPGFMRLVFSSVSPQTAVAGAERLGRFARNRTHH